MKIGYFGDESSHTYACALKNFPSDRLTGFQSIAAAAEAVEQGRMDGAVVPIENSVGGTVGDALDAIKNYGVYITAQYFMGISHSLIGLPGASKNGIKRIYSHPQALSQCDEYLKRFFPDALKIPVASTSAALKTLKSEDEAAVARSALPGQTVLDSEIEDVKSNTTRFVLIKSAPVFRGENVSVMFDTRHRPGELLKALNVLAGYDLNMHKLESRPSRDGVFRYWFYVEFDCRLDKEQLMAVMHKLEGAAGFIKFAGMYSSADNPT